VPIGNLQSSVFNHPRNVNARWRGKESEFLSVIAAAELLILKRFSLTSPLILDWIMGHRVELSVGGAGVCRFRDGLVRVPGDYGIGGEDCEMGFGRS